MSLAVPESEADNDKKPVKYVTQEQLNLNEIKTIGELLIVMRANLPIPESKAKYHKVVNKIKVTKNRIIEDTGDQILVQSFGTNDETGETEPTFKSKYYFTDGVLIRGPVLVDPENMKNIKVTGKRIK